MENYQQFTWEDIKVMFAKTDERLDRIIRENEKERQAREKELQAREKERQESEKAREKERQAREKERQESEKAREKEELKREKELKEMEKESKRLDRRLEKMYAEARRERKELNKQLGGISNSNGEIAEAYFYNAFKRDKSFVNEKFDYIKRNMKFVNGEHDAEFDILLFNGKSAAIIEVKYNAKPDNISVRRIVSRVKAFKLLYPKYCNHSIYLGVAAMSFRKGMEERLHRAGIATIRQVGKKMVVYDKEVKVF
jgi:hypothetical protein